jgi:hypothetical protein
MNSEPNWNVPDGIALHAFGLFTNMIFSPESDEFCKSQPVANTPEMSLACPAEKTFARTGAPEFFVARGRWG